MNAEPPLPLNTAARAFWDRHHDRLRAAGIMTDADVDSFCVLCLTWSKLAALASIEAGADQFREMIQLDRLTKQYAVLAKQFGLLPRDRRMAKMDGDQAPAKDEFGL